MRLINAGDAYIVLVDEYHLRSVAQSYALMEALDKVPTVDAVPVVRCKDCKWYEIKQLKRDGTEDKRYKQNVCVIGRYAKSRKADWYCADGERREE